MLRAQVRELQAASLESSLGVWVWSRAGSARGKSFVQSAGGAGHRSPHRDRQAFPDISPTVSVFGLWTCAPLGTKCSFSHACMSFPSGFGRRTRNFS